MTVGVAVVNVETPHDHLMTNGATPFLGRDHRVVLLDGQPEAFQLRFVAGLACLFSSRRGVLTEAVRLWGPLPPRLLQPAHPRLAAYHGAHPGLFHHDDDAVAALTATAVYRGPHELTAS